MAHILSEDDFSQTVMDDGGRVVVVPKGTLNIAGGEYDLMPPPGAPPPPQSIGMGAIPAAAAMGAPTPEAPKPVGPQPLQQPPPEPLPTPSTTAPPLKTKGDVQKAKQEATGEALGANAMATDAAVQQAQAETRVREQGQAEQEQLDVDQQNAEYLAQKKREAKAMGLEQAEKAFQSTKIDENRLWADSSTGKKVGWGIAMALSGIGNTLMGKGDAVNPVVGMLSAAIERDVQLQMEERRHLGEVANRKARDLDKMDAIIENQQARFHARAAALKERTADRIMLEASKFGDEQKAAAGMTAAAELKKSAADDRQKSLDTETQVALEKERNKIARAGVGAQYAQIKEGARQFDEKMKREDAQLELDAAKLAQAGNVKQAEEVTKLGIPGARTADGSPLVARTEKEAQELREARTATHRVVDITDELDQLIAKHGGIAGLVKSDEYQRVKANAGALYNELRVANKMGTLDKGSEAMLKTMAGDADLTGMASFLNNGRAGLKELRRLQLAKYNEQLRSQDENAAPYDISERTQAKATEAEKQAADLGAFSRGVPDTLPVAKLVEQAMLRNKGGGARTDVERWKQAHGLSDDAPRFEDKGLQPAQSTILDNLWIQARGGDANAIKTLQQAAGKQGAVGEAAKRRLAEVKR